MEKQKDSIPLDVPSYAGPSGYPGPPPPKYSESKIDGYPNPEPETVITTAPNVQTVVIGNAFGIDPLVMACPFCHEHMATRIERVVWLQTHVIAGMLCLMGCLPCVLIPYCTNVCKKAVHYCSKCDSYIGTSNVSQ